MIGNQAVAINLLLGSFFLLDVLKGWRLVNKSSLSGGRWATSPLVAPLERQDHDHARATTIAAQLAPPFLTGESVRSEACFLVNRVAQGKAAVMGMVKAGQLTVPFQLEAESARVQA